MEKLKNLSYFLGEKMVNVEGNRKVSLGEAVSFWPEHLIYKFYGSNKFRSGSSGYSIGMGENTPRLFGEENDQQIEE